MSTVILKNRQMMLDWDGVRVYLTVFSEEKYLTVQISRHELNDLWRAVTRIVLRVLGEEIDYCKRRIKEMEEEVKMCKERGERTERMEREMEEARKYVEAATNAYESLKTAERNLVSRPDP